MAMLAPAATAPTLRGVPSHTVSLSSFGRGVRGQKAVGGVTAEWSRWPWALATAGATCAACLSRSTQSAAAVVSVSQGKKTRRFWWTLCALLLPFLVASAPARAERWDDLSQRYAPDNPPVQTESTKVELALAKHLKEKGVLIFCTWYSRECQELRELFGKQAAELAPFVECVDKDRNFLSDDCPRQSANLVFDRKSNGDFPLWLIADKYYYAQDEISLPDAARLTNFRDFPSAEIRTEADFLSTRYIWS